MARGARQRAERRGRAAETRAALWLRLKGYRILETRLRTPVGEIDLIAKKGKVVAFIEVKARAKRDDALGAVTPASWQRIARAADVWMARRPRYAEHGWRYDLIALQPGRLPVHVRDAWRPGMA
tara:strand:- start:142645 stop:143016 length:372 start_codon:yes stop_codon:yes gene_type:complete